MRKLSPIALLALPFMARAQDLGCQYIFCNPLRDSVWGGVTNIQGALVVLLDLLISVAMPFIALSIIYTGFTFATSKGDPTKLKKARTMLKYVIVGTMIMLAAKGIGMAIQSTIGSVAGQSGIIGT